MFLARELQQIAEQLYSRISLLASEMDHQSELMPKDKHDRKAMERLRKLPIQELVPLLPELLEWVADINWPIARDAIDLVLTVPEHIVEPIRKVFQTTDYGWKNSCLNYVVPHLPVEQRRQLKPELERIAHQPTQDEIEEGTSDTAQELLNSIETGVDVPKS
jgi:hypothetical protein